MVRFVKNAKYIDIPSIVVVTIVLGAPLIALLIAA